jgi:hypothetical protein
MKSKIPEITSDRFAYALGLFVIIMIEQSDMDELIFNEDVRTIYAAFKRRHLREVRLRNKAYAEAMLIARHAYFGSVHEKKGGAVTINATVRLVQMKYRALMERVYKLDDAHFIGLTRAGADEHVMESVRVSNCYISKLIEEYGAFEESRKHNKKRAA